MSGIGLPAVDIVLPLAISFFTFQQIAWLVDNKAGKVIGDENSFIDYCLFVLFFPQLIAGPIVHHSEMMPQFANRKTMQFQAESCAAGITFFVIGLAKKITLADNLAPLANHAFDLAEQGEVINTSIAWLGSLAYSMQLYFDFSGYADMAIGLALLFNIRLPLNFNSPYKSLSIVNFWQRWHMTLSRFLRNYVYIPMGGNRKGAWRRNTGLMATMLLGGLWHGAAWSFVFWGGLHGIYLITNHCWKKYSPIKLPAIAAWLVTFIAVVFGWVFFRAESFSSALSIVNSMLALQSPSVSEVTLPKNDIALVLSAIFICVFLPNTQQLMSRKYSPIYIYESKDPETGSRVLDKLNLITLCWNIRSLLFVTNYRSCEYYFFT